MLYISIYSYIHIHAYMYKYTQTYMHKVTILRPVNLKYHLRKSSFQFTDTMCDLTLSWYSTSLNV